MAFGALRFVTLHVENNRYLEGIDSTPTAGDIADVLLALDYAYNIGGLTALYDQGNSVDLATLLSILRNARESGVYAANYALRAMIWEAPARLHVNRFDVGGSFTISVSGIADIIDVIAATFDPEKRRERREKNRHGAFMNRVEEERAVVGLAIDRFAALDAIASDLSNFNKRVRENLGTYDADELTQLLREAYGQAIYSLRANDIKTIESGYRD
jgi:hypothetical protein